MTTSTTEKGTAAPPPEPPSRPLSAVESILLASYASSQSESRSAQQNMHVVLSWSMTGVAALGGFLAWISTKDPLTAYWLGSVAGPIVAVAGGALWLNEFGRMLRGGLIGRRIECRLLALNPEQLEPSNLFEHALDMVEHENERAKARFRLGYGYIITAFISLAFVFGIQAYAYWKWGPSLVGEWKLFAQRVFLVYQAVALGCWGIYILNHFWPTCQTDCKAAPLTKRRNLRMLAWGVFFAGIFLSIWLLNYVIPLWPILTHLGSAIGSFVGSVIN